MTGSIARGAWPLGLPGPWPDGDSPTSGRLSDKLCLHRLFTSCQVRTRDQERMRRTGAAAQKGYGMPYPYATRGRNAEIADMATACQMSK